MSRHLSAGIALVVLLAAGPAPAPGAVTAFRVTDLDLRDPHTYLSFLGCRDFTNTSIGGLSFNGNLQTRIEGDADMDGLLDQSFLLVFDSVDPAGSGGAILFGTSSCTAPAASTSCGPSPAESLKLLSSGNKSSGSCLGALPGTVRPYSPAVAEPGAPCFASGEFFLVLDLNGIPFALRSARIAATYSGTPVTGLVTGLIRGFLAEADANNTIIPASEPIIGGLPLAAILPGGDPPGPDNTNCAAHSDKELGPDGVTPGWWMYFNFTAVPVPYTGPLVGVPEVTPPPPELTASPNPFRSSVTLECRQPRPGPVRVAVFDLQGRRVADLFAGTLPAGSHRFTWDGRTAFDRPAAPGIYLVRFAGGGADISRRIIFLP